MKHSEPVLPFKQDWQQSSWRAKVSLVLIVILLLFGVPSLGFIH